MTITGPGAAALVVGVVVTVDVGVEVSVVVGVVAPQTPRSGLHDCEQHWLPSQHVSLRP